MPRVIEVVRVTIPDEAVWRECPACLVLAAMAPEVERCDDCHHTDDHAAPGGGGRR